VNGILTTRLYATPSVYYEQQSAATLSLMQCQYFSTNQKFLIKLLLPEKHRINYKNKEVSNGMAIHHMKIN
jgi:hypothetical protein